jgi:hypothetical protein
VSTLNVNKIADASGGVLAPISSVMRNRIINGAMVIDQRNAGASVTPASGTYTYTIDRFRGYATAASKYTVQQNAGAVTPPVGFTNYLGATSSSAYSVTSSDTFFLSQVIEGFNIADLGWGTANAQTVTLSFLVRSSLTGTFGGSLRNVDTPNRSYPFNYTISSANTWTTISVTIAGDTTGTWNTTNGQGIQVQWNLGSGSTFSGTAGSWQAGNLIAPTGATSVVGTNGATFYITGVQLEKGTQATGFEYRQYGQELALCQRYFRPVFAWGTPYQSTGCVVYATVNSMRTSSPTVTLTSLTIDGVGQPTSPVIASISSSTTDALRINVTYSAAGGIGYPTFMIGTTSTEL